MAINVRENVVHQNPQNTEERIDLASVCVRKLGIEIPALVDDFDNSTDMAYTGWPDRLFVVDREGRIVYKSAPGPFGFKPEDLERALAELVGATDAS